MKYTPEQLKFLRIGYRQMRIPALTQAFNAAFGTGKTQVAIKSALTNNGFTCGRSTGFPKGMYLIFTREQAEYIQKHYQQLNRHDLTTALNAHFGTAFTVRQVVTFTKNHGIASGRTGHFTPGQKGWNTGTKGLIKPNSGSFKKGSIPPNLYAMGQERLSKDGYIEVKVPQSNPYTGAPTWFRFKHRLVWEAEHGPIPAGQVIVFLDGDKTNCELENLRCVSRAVLTWMNKTGLSNTEGDARKAAILTAEVFTKTKKIERARA